MIFLVILFIFYCLIAGCNSEDPFVTIPQGHVQGYYKKSFNGRTYSAFEGIPYAKPPVGHLRFAEPEAADNWNGVLIANKTYRCACYIPIVGLRGVMGDENCLYVYVYVPLRRIVGDENLNVIIHIHGGAFMVGSPGLVAGPDYLLDEDVVYVSFNYRLAILGFLSTEDNVVSGNNGLKDQVMALKWVKDNIKYFGGNPDSITLTGFSAGGASVHYHYLSPLSKGLFHRGLSQSGTALVPWAIIEKPLTKAKQVASHLDCPTHSTKEMVECLRKTTAKDLLTAMSKLFLYFKIVPLIIFGPVIEKGDNPFLNEHPYTLIKRGEFQNVPWITSNVKDEGIFVALGMILTRATNEVDKKWDEIIPYLLDLYDTVDEADKMAVTKSIRKYYYDHKPLAEDNLSSMVELINDRFFFTDTEQAIRLQSAVNKSEVYYYFFTYIPTNPSIPYFGIKKGVCHGDDVALLFKTSFIPLRRSSRDEKMIKIFTQFIATYANTSKPSFNNIEWLPVTPGSKLIDTMKIESPTKMEMIKMEAIGSSKFWEDLPIKENRKLFPVLR
ncbi:venom carboxylesterase-6-like [Diorhabda carinulata]|uniref:venom carboxylesterase-6-like n=1 Tax=Diorhabda carinulata TaxID=1163345 RepID=UPI0025A04C3C|nr:venom carboxylesterase-6-like [Diorhabda carinulata]